MEPARFREAMGLFPTGVAVIAAALDGEIRAMTANAVCSLSLDPPLILFCPARRSRFAERIGSLGGFSVNFLREDHAALSSYFAGAWREPAPPPFRFVDAGPAPRLEGCLASVSCTVESVTEGGDHWIVIGRVADLHVGIPPHRPLVFFGARYRELACDPGREAPEVYAPEYEPPHIHYHYP